MALVRTEELQDWIFHITKSTPDDEHLSVLLQDGQLLCMLVNAIDPNANIKINRLKTVFHSKGNIQNFLKWCRANGFHDGDLFSVDNLMDGKDFMPVVKTLSLLYDAYARASCTGPMDIPGDEPVSDSGSHTSSAESVGTPPPSPKKATSKLASFMKATGGFLSSSGKAKQPRNWLGKTISTPHTSGTPPMSPEAGTPPIDTSFQMESPKNIRSESGASNGASKLNDFLSEVPPANTATLQHTQRAKGPAKRQSFTRPRSELTPTIPAEVKTPIQDTPTENNPRNKFAAFMRKNPPAQKNAVSSKLVSVSATKPPPPKPAPKPIPEVKKAPVQVSKPITMPTSSSRPAANSGANKLNAFVSSLPSQPVDDVTKPRSKSKLAAFIASTASTYESPTLNSTASNNTKAPSSFSRMAKVNAFAAEMKSNQAGNSLHQNKPKTLNRSTGCGNYVKKRQTYIVSRSKRRSNFSLEKKRQEFMNTQLRLKQEQLKQQDGAGGGKSQNLILPGVKCYVPDNNEVWVLSEITDYNPKSKVVSLNVSLGSGEHESRQLDLSDPAIIKTIGGPNATEILSLPVALTLPSEQQGVHDMRLLRYLNEPSILFNLKQRFEASSPYTYTNDIVIAVNPYKWMPHLYGDDLHQKYLKHPRKSLQPHVYATSTLAYNNLCKNEKNQSILVSGESGAGKTETTKIVMNHLASIAGGRKDSTIAKVIDVNPLLESFGNAKTTRNDNSSRFGKFTQLQFNARGKLIGAKCETYLLEKSRVVSIASGERNYHIFYQMLKGLSKKELSLLDLEASETYEYVGHLSTMCIDGIDDSEWLANTRKSLKLIGLDSTTQQVLFQILAGILHLGNLEIASINDDSSSCISNPQQLARVANQFGLPPKQIEHALCHRTVITRNDSVTVPLAAIEATENRDALAKTIYSKLFDWLVSRINEAISAEDEYIGGQIGVLDIFGFEDFKHNGFEQFCINYANEKLQQKFTTDVFKTVEEEYMRENLIWDHIQYQDNSGIVDLVDGKMGIIAIMNDHLRQARGTEEALVNKMKASHEKPKKSDTPEVIAFPKTKRTQFIIHHYAGSVQYETIGFMEKHRDTLQNDLQELVQASELDLLPLIFAERKLSATSSPRSRQGAKSLGSQFKKSLQTLMENIHATESHYIRCIKPNANKSPVEFNNRMVVDQLRSAGVIEAIRITRQGYPSRLTPKELAERYAIMFPPSMRSKNDDRRTCTVFMSSIGRSSPTEYQMGKTLIYFKNGVMEELEAMKSDFMYLEAACIQKLVLGFIERRRFRRKINASIVIQSIWRTAIDQKAYHRQLHAIRTVQFAWRRYISKPNTMDFDDLDDSSDDEDYEVSSNHNESQDTRSFMDKIRGFTSNRKMSVGDATRTSSEESEREEPIERPRSRSRRTDSIRRMEELSIKAQSFLKGQYNDTGVSYEEENQMLRVENRNLKYDLELMREQCIELQAIILEINKSRKR